MALCNLPARYPWEREGSGGPHAGCTDDEGKGIKGKVGEGGRAGGRAMKGGALGDERTQAALRQRRDRGRGGRRQMCARVRRRSF